MANLAQSLEERRVEQQTKLGELLSPFIEALNEIFAAWKHYSHKEHHYTPTQDSILPAVKLALGLKLG